MRESLRWVMSLDGSLEPLVPRLRGVSHAAAFVLSVAAATVAVALAPTGRARVAVAIYGVGMVHAFVIAAAAAHYIAVVGWVLPVAGT